MRRIYLLSALGSFLTLISQPVSASTCPTFFPPVTTGVVGSAAVNEASGMVASQNNPGIYWVHNDSGDSPRAFAIRADGVLVATYSIAGAAAVDWEDMAIGPGPDPGVDYLFFGDIGDNSAVRSHLTVYRVAEPLVDPDQVGASLVLEGAVALEMEYPDGPHDAETLLSDPLTGDLFVITKCRASAGCTNGVSQVFRYPFPHQEGVRVTLTEVATIPFTGGAFVHAATAGDVSWSGERIAVRTYTQALLWERAPGQSVDQALATSGCSVPVPPQIQGETLAFSTDGTSYASLSEFANQPILRIDERFDDQLVSGTRLVVKDPSAGTNPTKRKVSASAREKASGHTIVGDPVLRGAVLEVIASGGNPTDQTFLLGSGTDGRGKEFWRTRGSSSFKYSDPRGERGPVKKVILRRSGSGTMTMKVLIDGKNGTLDIVPPGPGTEGFVTLRFPGGDRYCVKFGAEAAMVNDGVRSWKVRRPVAEGCPP